MAPCVASRLSQAAAADRRMIVAQTAAAGRLNELLGDGANEETGVLVHGDQLEKCLY